MCVKPTGVLPLLQHHPRLSIDVLNVKQDTGVIVYKGEFKFCIVFAFDVWIFFIPNGV